MQYDPTFMAYIQQANVLLSNHVSQQIKPQFPYI